MSPDTRITYKIDVDLEQKQTAAMADNVERIAKFMAMAKTAIEGYAKALQEGQQPSLLVKGSMEAIAKAAIQGKKNIQTLNAAMKQATPGFGVKTPTGPMRYGVEGMIAPPPGGWMPDVSQIERVREALRKPITIFAPDEDDKIKGTNKALEEFRRKLERVGKSIKRIRQRISRVARQVRAWGRNFLWLGRDITVFTSMAIGGALAATQAWARFEEQLKVTGRVLVRRGMDAENVAQALSFENVILGTQALEGMTKEMAPLLETSNDMAISVTAATTSFSQLVRAGYDVAQSVEIANQAMILNRGSMISLADATQMMINVNRAWKENMYSAANVADIMTLADENAIASLSELNAGMAYIMGTAARMGMTLEQSAAAMTVLTNAGFSGSVAGRELRSVLNNLVQNAEDYGIQVRDASGELIPFENILQNVEDRMDTFGSEIEKTQYLQEVFGETNLSLVQTLIENRDELAKLTEEYENSGGAAQKAADDMKNTLEYQLDRIRVAFEKVTLAVGKGFADAMMGGTSFVPQLADAIEAMLPYVERAAYAFGIGFVQSVQTWVSIAQTAIDYVLDFGESLGFVTKTSGDSGKRVDDIAKKVGMVAGFAIVAGPAMMGLGLAMEVLSPILFTLSAAFTVLSMVWSIASGAASLLAGALAGVTISAGPLILLVLAIIVVIIAAAGAFQGLMENLHHVQALFVGLSPILEGVMAVLFGLWSILKPIVELIFILGKIWFLLNLIVLGFLLKLPPVQLFIQLIGEGLKILGGFLKWVGDLLDYVVGIFEAAAGILQSVVDIIFGTSPGLIPGLEMSTDALKDFNAEAAKTEGVDLSSSFGATTDELYGMTGANLATYGEGGVGGMVELGPDTRTFLSRLFGVEPETDWSFPGTADMAPTARERTERRNDRRQTSARTGRYGGVRRR